MRMPKFAVANCGGAKRPVEVISVTVSVKFLDELESGTITPEQIIYHSLSGDDAVSAAVLMSKK